MGIDADQRAFDALGEVERLADLAAVAWAVMQSAIAGDPPEAGAAIAGRRAGELALTQDEVSTPFGNALDVLQRQPEGAAERALVRALAARAWAARPEGARRDVGRTAGELVGLAARTPFDATGLLDRVSTPEENEELWTAMADRVRRADRGTLPAPGCAEGLVAAVALASSESPAAIRLVASLLPEVSDPKLVYVLERGHARLEGGPVVGEVAPKPHGPVVTALLCVSGISVLARALRSLARFGLAYRRPVEVTLESGGDIRVRSRTEMLGRTLREYDVLLPRAHVARAARDVRYPSFGLYVGLLALAFGTFVGVSLLVEGARSGSGSVVTIGLASITLGVAIDFILSSLLPGRRGRCRLLLVPRRGPPLCVGRLEIAAADALLARLGRTGS
jgi:hypothetical protein